MVGSTASSDNLEYDKIEVITWLFLHRAFAHKGTSVVLIFSYILETNCSAICFNSVYVVAMTVCPNAQEPLQPPFSNNGYGDIPCKGDKIKRLGLWHVFKNIFFVTSFTFLFLPTMAKTLVCITPFHPRLKRFVFRSHTSFRVREGRHLCTIPYASWGRRGGYIWFKSAFIISLPFSHDVLYINMDSSWDLKVCKSPTT